MVWYSHLFKSFPQASVVVQLIKNPPAMQENWVQSLGWEDPLEEGAATHSTILAWRIPMDRGAWRATISRGAKSQTQPSNLAQQHVTSQHLASHCLDFLCCPSLSLLWLTGSQIPERIPQIFEQFTDCLVSWHLSLWFSLIPKVMRAQLIIPKHSCPPAWRFNSHLIH